MVNCRVLWVGLSDKLSRGDEVFQPLNRSTNSGKLIQEIEERCQNISFEKTNLVSFAPLNSQGKLRYPTIAECESYFPQLQVFIDKVDPKIIFLLGIKTSHFVTYQLGLPMAELSFERYNVLKYEGRFYTPIHHPSYIMVYKRKEKEQYIKMITMIIDNLIGQ